MHIKSARNSAEQNFKKSEKDNKKRKKRTKKKKDKKDKMPVCKTESKKSIKEVKSQKSESDKLTSPSVDEEEIAQMKAMKIEKALQKEKRIKEQIKMMFTSSIDPLDKPLRWWEDEHIKYAFTYSPVRSRLEYLMGSNVVRLTDRKYMLKLIARIRQDHENKQDIRVQERKMQELMRTKNMILSRFIPVEEAPAEIFEYPLFQLYMYCDSLMEKKRRKRIKKVKMSKSLYQLLYPEKLETEFADEEEMDEVPMKEVIIDGEPQLVPLSKEEIEAMAKEKETALEIKNGYMFTKEEYENLHYEADAIKKLKETKTVNEMYAKAHEIVGFCFSLVGEPRNRCTQDEEMMPLSEVQSKIESASHASSKASKATSKASKARSRK